ncbi:MAG: hypothetical protein CMK59_09815 [Proteobacteria bacterium]|nr:hypothetical protein [Pseudomonadota bacterium]
MNNTFLMMNLALCLTACGAKKPVVSSVEAVKKASENVEDSVEHNTELKAEQFAWTHTDLVGTWQGSCFSSPSADGSFNQLTFQMTDQEWSLDYSVYADESCEIKFITVNIIGPYSLGAKIEIEEGAREGTFRFVSRSITPHIAPAIDLIKETCGFENLSVGMPADLASGCTGLGVYPIADCDADYDIVMLKDNVLHFGQRPADNNMCTAEKRPSSFDGGAQVTKQ